MEKKLSPAKIAAICFEDFFVANGTTVSTGRRLRLIDKSFDLTVISSSNKRQDKKAINTDLKTICLGTSVLSYKTIPFPIDLVPILIWNIKLSLALLSNKFDIVLVAEDWLGYFGVYLVSKIKRFKIIFEAHDVFSQNLQEIGHTGILLRMDRWLEQFAIKHSDFVIALSPNTLEFYQSHNPTIEMVPTFIDTTLFHPAIKALEPQKGKLVGVIGPFLSSDSRQGHILEFLYSRINDFDSRISFVVVGRCNNQIQNERIRYTGYLNSEKDYASEISNLDAVLVPEKIATTGPLNKLLEPMACEVPVFATPKAMTGLHWVQAGRDILVYEEDELVSKINELLFNDELMTAIGKKGRDVVEKYYSKQVNEDKIIGILKSVAGD